MISNEEELEKVLYDQANKDFEAIVPSALTEAIDNYWEAHDDLYACIYNLAAADTIDNRNDVVETKAAYEVARKALAELLK